MGAGSHLITDPVSVWNHLQTYKGKRAFDIGAHHGETLALFAPRFSEVVAFEPLPEAYEILEQQLTPNVVTVNLAISEHPETLMFKVTQNVGKEPFTQLSSVVVGERVSVRGITLDDAVVEYGAPDFIKIDTEGQEVNIIRSGLNYLREKPSLFIECHFPSAAEEIQELLPWYSFHLQRHDYYEPDSVEWLSHYFIWS